jgi:hypothetical protein
LYQKYYGSVQVAAFSMYVQFILKMDFKHKTPVFTKLYCVSVNLTIPPINGVLNFNHLTFLTYLGGL